MEKMSTTLRILIALGGLILVAAYFVPAWSIYLIAPQYPEGLSMQIWLYKISGQVDIINGLNHYIGMKHINADMFPEFTYMPYILGGFILFAMIIAITGSRKMLFTYLILSVLGAIAALVDFYIWGYDYGHNLDPTAAIQVPGLSYQPPLIGHKKLLNFDAYSYPDTGGWIIIGVTALFALIWFLSRKKQTKVASVIPASKTVFTSAALSLLLLACNPKPEKIAYGKDVCAECKMTIMDPKFGGEIVTKKGRVYKFDDTHCIAAFLKNRRLELGNIAYTLFTNYQQKDDLINVQSAEFVVSSILKSPMGGNAAAFPSKAEAEKHSATLDGSKTTNWPTLYNILVK
jgi:copper chaperone NosL